MPQNLILQGCTDSWWEPEKLQYFSTVSACFPSSSSPPVCWLVPAVSPCLGTVLVIIGCFLSGRVWVRLISPYLSPRFSCRRECDKQCQLFQLTNTSRSDAATVSCAIEAVRNQFLLQLSKDLPSGFGVYLVHKGWYIMKGGPVCVSSARTHMGVGKRGWGGSMMGLGAHPKPLSPSVLYKIDFFHCISSSIWLHKYVLLSTS